MKTRSLFAFVVLLSIAHPGRSERIKDIIDIQGMRGNPLSGIGLIVGLAGTGDKTLPSQQMLTNIFRDYEVVVSPTALTGGNVAVVMVTAELGPFAAKGSRIDVDVSSIGDAESLQGGILLPTPLKGLDGQVYAVARGAVFIGGWSATGKQASIVKNHPTVGRIPGGAHVEKEERATIIENIADLRFLTLNLRNNDFTTAQNVGRAIDQLHPGCATVLDAGTIRIQLPPTLAQAQMVGFIDQITMLNVEVDNPAIVVINERTGTIVVGDNVGISAVAISQGGLVVKVKETEIVSQPAAPFTESATTQKVPDTLMGIEEKEGYLIPVQKVVTVAELAKALNAIGATPRDLIAIFNALKMAGALHARLEIM
jgi:flagellar P-ring protein precursor FlgI